MKVIFQSGEFYMPDNSMWPDFIISTLAALIGTGTALLIFYLQTRHDLKKRKEELLQNDNQKLHYFSSNLSSVIKTAKNQLPFFKSFENSIKENPYKIPYLTILSGNTLKRLAEDLNYEVLYHPFIQKFGDTREITTRFSQIIAIIDFLHSQNNQLKEITTKVFDADYEKKMKFREIVERRMDDVAEIGAQSVKGGGNVEFSLALNDVINEFYRVEFDNSDIEYFQSKFVLPVREICIEHLLDTSLAGRMLRDMKSANQIFASIESGNLQLMSNITRIHDRYKLEVERLENLTFDLRKLYGSSEIES